MLAYRAAERHPLVESYLATQVPAPLQPAREIAAGDFMLRFFLEHRHGHRDLALVDYFQSGWSLARTLRQVLAWRWGEHLPGRVLDFACGFGRGTRYLVRLLPAETVTVADIFAEAVAFQRQLLGVRGFVSAADPGVVRCEERFDLIVVSSLFSHLPQSRFRPWLSRLAGWLAPGGVLAFSVHDQALLLSGRRMPAGGFWFEPMTEIDELASEEYGVAWVSEEYVREAIAAVVPGARCWRAPRALWAYQDLYLVSVGEGPGERPQLAAEPLGYLDRCEQDPVSGELELLGWAVDPIGAGLEAVEVSLDGEVVAVVVPDQPWPEVAAHLNDPRHQRAGWRCRVAAPDGPRSPSSVLRVRARNQAGVEVVLHLGTLEATRLYLELTHQVAARRRLEERRAALEQQLAEAAGREERLCRQLASGRAEIRALHARIAAMEQSRFWKLRNAWWRLRGRLGLAPSG